MKDLHYSLRREETVALLDAIDRLQAAGDATSQQWLLKNLWRFSLMLPESLHEPIQALRRGELESLRLNLGSERFITKDPTPQSHPEREPGYAYNPLQFALLILGSALGSPIGFSYVRRGAFISNIIPLLESAAIPNVTANYHTPLAFHTEDAFHPYCADYLGLACNRNNEQAPTWLTSVDGAQVTGDMWDALAEPRFIFKPNVLTPPLRPFSSMPVLWGCREHPYLRIPVQRDFATDESSDRAFRALMEILEQNKRPIVLKQGEVLFFDNLRLAHGRGEYAPSFGNNGGGRWLSRCLVAGEIRRSVAFRSSMASTVFT